MSWFRSAFWTTAGPIWSKAVFLAAKSAAAEDVTLPAGLMDCRVHDLRHSYASILASAGLSLPVIGALLGHTQPATTARYAHLLDDPLRAATERVGAIVEAAAGRGKTADVVEIHGRK